MGSTSPAYMTPLHIAAREGHAEIVKLLISQGADKNARDFVGRTPFFEAIKNQKKKIAELLLDLNPDVDVQGGYDYETPLMPAIFWGYFDIAKELLRRGARVNVRERYEGNTPLHFAAQKTDRELVEILLSKGADPAVKNRYGRTPADEAEKAKNPEIAELLQVAIKGRER